MSQAEQVGLTTGEIIMLRFSSHLLVATPDGTAQV